MSTIRVHVLSPDTFSERKYDLHMTIGQLKGKLESVTGIAPESQRLTVHRSIDEQNSAPLHVLDDDSGGGTIKESQPRRLIIPKGGGYQYQLFDWPIYRRVSCRKVRAHRRGVPKTKGYWKSTKFIDPLLRARLIDTVLAYKQANKIGRFADSAQAPEIHVYTASPEIKPGARCKVETEGDGDIKRGVVRFVGPTKFGKEVVIGLVSNMMNQWVKMTARKHPLVLGRGHLLILEFSVQGERYFTCPAKHGAFVRPDRITVGDFPPVDPFADEQFEI
ncbi:CAP-Gly domain-containing protein [Rhizoctonia solani AG-1 IA]|uniref:CAP-Gly domain-containing protein n=1 Tax=Thanatephorus cucumeris (strain AG1-IA) TaxID=983506 RepID=L8X458_THACA|nr:CAP-Gly domain-containing protein [Rhizoctonia solani AG-1 IA]